jgi:hypothetical protein
MVFQKRTGNSYNAFKSVLRIQTILYLIRMQPLQKMRILIPDPVPGLSKIFFLLFVTRNF